MSEHVTDILIFSAGFGTRMAPLTDTLPKPLISVAGRPLVDRALSLADEAALNIHVNAHYRADQLVQHLPEHVTAHVERPDILDTGGGLKSALSYMSGDAVMTLNSDAVWHGPNPLKMLRDAWRPQMEALLLLVPLEQTVGYSRTGNFSMGRHEVLTRDADGQVYTGAQIVRRNAVTQISDTVFSLNKVWEVLLAKGTIHGISYPGKWADVGTPAGIPLAEAMLDV